MARYLKRAAVALVLATGLIGPGVAEDDEARHRFSDDVYAAGFDVRIGEADVEDVFAAGETVTVETGVRESVHAAGRQIWVNGAVGDNLYGAGYRVDVGAAVGGNMIAAAYRVEIGAQGSIGRDALVGGRYVYIRGPIGGDANLAGQTVEIAAPISGSVEIRAAEIRFAEGARIDGTLAYWSDSLIDVPASVIGADRVTGHVIAAGAPVGIVGYVVGGVVFIVIVLGVSAVFAWLFPAALGRARQRLGERPWRSLLLGVVAASALIGSVPVLGASIIGIPLVPVAVIVIPLALLAGYLTTAYVLGSLALGLVRVQLGSAGLAAFAAIIVGLVVLAIIGFIPIFGWVVAVIAAVTGLGAWLALYWRIERRAPGAPA